MYGHQDIVDLGGKSELVGWLSHSPCIGALLLHAETSHVTCGTIEQVMAE